jgi:hypothetical protein
VYTSCIDPSDSAGVRGGWCESASSGGPSVAGLIAAVMATRVHPQQELAGKTPERPAAAPPRRRPPEPFIALYRVAKERRTAPMVRGFVAPGLLPAKPIGSSPVSSAPTWNLS